MPDSILKMTPITSIKQRDTPSCPGSWYEDLQVSRSRDPKGPLWQPSFGHNMEEVMTTIHSMQEYDGDESVFVILAHDPSLRSSDAPFFPEPINDWKQRRLSQKLRWKWTEEILDALND